MCCFSGYLAPVPTTIGRLQVQALYGCAYMKYISQTGLVSLLSLLWRLRWRLLQWIENSS